MVQGITEFLPISSSGHLQIIWDLFDNPLQGASELGLDVALHVGTLLAVVLYFWRDVIGLLGGGIDLLRFKRSARANEVLMIVIATIPVFVIGFLIKDNLALFLREALLITIAATIGFAILLWIADRRDEQSNHLTLGGAAFVGAMQVLALIPGTSRSGVTMTAARFLGVSRTEAARFSLLLSIPVILGAGTLITLDLIGASDAQVLGRLFLIGGALSFVCAYGAIWLMMRWLKDASFTPFVIYRLILGAVLLALYF